MPVRTVASWSLMSPVSRAVSAPAPRRSASSREARCGLDRGEGRGASDEGRVAEVHGGVGLGARQVDRRRAKRAASAAPRSRRPIRGAGRGRRRRWRPPRARSGLGRQGFDVAGDHLEVCPGDVEAGAELGVARIRELGPGWAAGGCRARPARPGAGGEDREQHTQKARGSRARTTAWCGSARSACGADRSIGPCDYLRTPPPPASEPDPRFDRLLEAMPKAELHLHLDGSLRIGTALDLARTRGVEAPATWRGMFDALVAPMPCVDQAELLKAFDLPIALMQDAEALERITASWSRRRPPKTSATSRSGGGRCSTSPAGCPRGWDRGGRAARTTRGTGPGPSSGSSRRRCGPTTRSPTSASPRPRPLP